MVLAARADAPPALDLLRDALQELHDLVEHTDRDGGAGRVRAGDGGTDLADQVDGVLRGAWIVVAGGVLGGLDQSRAIRGRLVTPR
ncbi:hypothetical protein [Streptomyces violascens]|uniref:hypothetical protein n=1 Tax=Streptomyces violascens TaxID=67381 RepID=UPI00364E36C5